MDQEPTGKRSGAVERSQRTVPPLSAGLLANLSHELRTPLNAILGWAQVLGRGGIDDAVLHRAADAIARNVRAQSALVDELLDLSRLDAGTLRLDAGDCDVAALLGQTADALAAAARARWIEVDSSGVAPRGLSCRGDAARLKQAFRHVLDNAVKHALLNGTVRVAAARDDALLRISIADDGDGIAPADLPHVFDGLHRADAAPRPGGLGIGLALARGLVELHGGHIEVASAGPGRGTTVRIELPAAEAARLPQAAPSSVPAAVEAAATTGAATAGAAAPPVLAWRRILLLEDDVDTLEVTSLLLREHGAIVHAFDNAELALAAAENGSFDLVVSDLGMPGMNGIEFMSRLRAAAGDVTAIALTAYAGDEPRQQALAAGFRRVEIKPIDAQRLLAAVKAELARGPSP